MNRPIHQRSDSIFGAPGTPLAHHGLDPSRLEELSPCSREIRLGDELGQRR